MVDLITESDMNFIADNTFHIEKSNLYTDLGSGIKSVEFVRAKDNKLLFVEAKTTFPNPNNPSEENLKRFYSAIEEINDKFIHSLNLFSSVKVGVAENVFPTDFILPERFPLLFILVIKNHKPEWCRKIKLKIETSFPSYLKKIWKPTVYVINYEDAIKRNLAIG